MGKSKIARSFLEQLADYDDPAPKDFDPEKAHNEQDGADLESGDEEESSPEEAREHYIDVDESKLRKSDAIDLGPQYSGASVSRDSFQNGDDGVDEENEPFKSPWGSGESHDDRSEMEEAEDSIRVFSEFTDGDVVREEEGKDRTNLKTSSGTPSLSSDEGRQYDDDDDDDDDDGDDTDDDNDDFEDEDNGIEVQLTGPAHNDRAVLRRMMAEEQKSVAASLSAAARADKSKGKAIKQQRKTFDSLLNSRIKLQKALIATNTMATVSEPSRADSAEIDIDCASASHAAEQAALNLWDSISSLRNVLSEHGAKRPRSPPLKKSNQALWKQVINLDDEAKSRRRATLTKWSQRTNPITALRPQNRFSQTPVQQPLTSVIDQQLTGESVERAIKRTRVARSCAPAQAASKVAVEDEKIYDDADFYSLLLRELVDRRMADTQSAPAASQAPDIAHIVPSRADLKVKKQVDTKASKGRKMRFTVHEKLQNFMAADDRGSWGERQRAELFGSLLGRKVEMAEAHGNDSEIEDDEAEGDGGVLKLFGQ